MSIILVIEIHMSRRKAQTALRLTTALRIASAQSLLISQAVAAKIGLNTTDLECLDIIQTGQLVSAGEIAKKTGLTTGAVTTLLDRLEKAGYVKRQADPNDRRRVMIAIRPERLQPLADVYAPLQAAMEALYRDYPEADLLTIADFTERAAAVSSDFVRSLNDG
ncbi:MAG: MarR family winged helix-turn-helix transcriptional regulator [Afipia sp.]